MNKLLITAAISLAAITASATEIGFTAGKDYAKSTGGCGFIVGPMTCNHGEDRNEYGVTIGQQFKAIGLTAGISRSTGGSPVSVPTDGPYKGNTQDRFSLVASYGVTKIGPVSVIANLGTAYLNNSRAADGYALTVGAGVSVPVAKNISLTADYARQYGQTRVAQFDGNRISAGLKYSF